MNSRTILACKRVVVEAKLDSVFLFIILQAWLGFEGPTKTMIFPHLLVATALSRPKPIAIYYTNKQVLRIYNICLTVFVPTAITITISTPAFITTNNPALHKYTPEYHPDKNNNQSDNNNNRPSLTGTVLANVTLRHTLNIIVQVAIRSYFRH